MPTIRRNPSLPFFDVRLAFRNHGLAVLLLCTAIGGISCKKPEETAPIAYGVDRCTECSRVIAERRFAAQYRTAAGDRRVFDDPGCLFRAIRKEKDRAESIRFQDHELDQWLDADEIWFVRTPQSSTPAGYGWIACGTFSAAQDAVTSGGSGEVVRFDEAKQKVAAEN
jgi:hypothetical protein